MIINNGIKNELEPVVKSNFDVTLKYHYRYEENISSHVRYIGFV